MAFRRAFTKRLYDVTGAPVSEITHETSPLKTLIPPNAVKTNTQREYLTSPNSGTNGFFRRLFPRRSIYQSSISMPEFLSLPVGEKLKRKLRGMNVTGDRLRFDGLTPPTPTLNLTPTVNESVDALSVMNARKLLRIAQVLKLKSTLQQIPMNSISYDEYVRICIEGCGNEDQAFEIAKMLDEAGNVIVIGNIVFLRPEQVAKSMETIITQSIAMPNDQRRKELDQMETQKAIIDKRAESLVKGELYCGLGFLVLQTLGFMRLTFWELSWDVMEPICFFVTSLHFVGAYGFFLRTSNEPSFEGYFRRRFKSKQKKLMEVHNFDLEKYNQLCEAYYPHPNNNFVHK